MSLLAFLVAITVLVAVHEYGHYRVAVACGVKVLRFSVGFGKVLYTYKPKKPRPHQNTEFVISAIPLGGYVKMLDEREAPVAPDELPYAFNQQSLGKRAAIVAAGPLANFLLAIILYSCLQFTGLRVPAAVMATPLAGSVAEMAGVRAQDRYQNIESMGDLYEATALAKMSGQALELRSQDGRQVRIALDRIVEGDLEQDPLQTLGFQGVWMPPVLGELLEGGAAKAAGLQTKDEIVSINQQSMQDAAMVRLAIKTGGAEQLWVLKRQNKEFEAKIKPLQSDQGWRVGAYIGGTPEMVSQEYGLLQSLQRGMAQTWKMSSLSLRILGKMLIGQASVKNITGPISIAEFAGKSAESGWQAFVLFLALISVSLGVMNLLPVPMLDGGHLMYYLWEWMRGKPLSDGAQAVLQRVGMLGLLLLMGLALFNDVSRLIG